MPVLVLHGEDDPLPVECATDLAGRLPKAHLTVVPGVGHNPWLEDEAAVPTALRHFLTHLPRWLRATTFPPFPHPAAELTPA
jgi:pimeloyl-ACP methyl ester carboxylesterase